MWEIVFKTRFEKKNISVGCFDDFVIGPVFQTVVFLVRNENSMKSARTNFYSGQFYKEKSLV